MISFRIKTTVRASVIEMYSTEQVVKCWVNVKPPNGTLSWGRQANIKTSCSTDSYKNTTDEIIIVDDDSPIFSADGLSSSAREDVRTWFAFDKRSVTAQLWMMSRVQFPAWLKKSWSEQEFCLYLSVWFRLQLQIISNNFLGIFFSGVLILQNLCLTWNRKIDF